MWSHMVFVHSVRSFTTTYWKIYGFSSTNAIPCLAMLVKVMTDFRILIRSFLYPCTPEFHENGLMVYLSYMTNKQTNRKASQQRS